MAAKNPKFVFNAFKINCDNKIKKIEAFVATNTGDLDAKKVTKLEGLNTDLEDQLRRMELAWDNSMTGITDNAELEMLQKIVKDTQTAVNKALDDSERFIDEKSVQNPGTGTSSAGQGKIDDTLRPKETLLQSFTLEEANLWFQRFTAYCEHNARALNGQSLAVQRQLLDNCIEAGLASALQTDDKVKVVTSIK